MAEGGITRRYAPRPFGAALRALSPLRGLAMSLFSPTGFTYRIAEREGLTRACGPRPSGDAGASSKIAEGDFVEPSMGF